MYVEKTGAGAFGDAHFLADREGRQRCDVVVGDVEGGVTAGEDVDRAAVVGVIGLDGIDAVLDIAEGVVAEDVAVADDLAVGGSRLAPVVIDPDLIGGAEAGDGDGEGEIIAAGVGGG